ncbi:nuclease-related domain-containing protein [Geodermatophilus sp. SYSU D01062]
MRCPSHTASAPAPGIPAASADAAARATGTAGGSAQDEYARRRARHERRVRDAHPVLGGLVLALSEEPQHVTAWRQGAIGERAVARRLDQLVDRGVEVLHDRRIPGSRANIDHLAVSPSGVYVIDAKNHTGTVRVSRQSGLFGPRRYRLSVGRRDATSLVASVQRQAHLVRDALTGGPGIPPGVAVTGVLTFVGADWPLFPPDRIDDVRLEGPKSAAKLVLRDGPYSPAQVGVIAEQLRRHFPAHRPVGR